MFANRTAAAKSRWHFLGVRDCLGSHIEAWNLSGNRQSPLSWGSSSLPGHFVFFSWDAESVHSRPHQVDLDKSEGWSKTKPNLSNNSASGLFRKKPQTETQINPENWDIITAGKFKGHHTPGGIRSSAQVCRRPNLLENSRDFSQDTSI